MWLKQSTAITILIGPVVDVTGIFVTTEVVGNLRITKNGVVGALDGSATLTHDHTGHYLLALSVLDVDTLGRVQISLNDGNNAMPVVSGMVVSEITYDGLIAAAELLQVNAVNIAGDNVPADVLKDITTGVGGRTLTIDAITDEDAENIFGQIGNIKAVTDKVDTMLEAIP